MEREARQQGRQAPFPYVLTFDRLLGETGFVKDMRGMLATLQAAYRCPVDVEFTLNFFPGDAYRVNLVQCRPLQVSDPGAVQPAREPADPADLILSCRGPVIGRGINTAVDWFVYVVPSAYSELPLRERHEVARAIGEITHRAELENQVIMLLGPGRWATSSPELGVPVRFADISGVAIVCEIVAMRDSLVPDVSLGTHFFNEIVENNMLYLAFFPRQEANRINTAFFENGPCEPSESWLSEAGDWTRALRVIRVASNHPGLAVRFHASPLEQKAVCYFDRPPSRPAT
jgi:hypothetical protein